MSESMGEQLDLLISRYEEEFSQLDSQDWEQELPRGLENFQSTKKTRIKTDFIDVDLVRGSTFTKSKTRHGLLSLVYFSLVSLLCFPFKRAWWIEKTSGCVYMLGSIVYFSCIGNLVLYNLYLCSSPELLPDQCEQLTAHELYEPVILFGVLVILQCHIVSPRKPTGKTLSVRKISNVVGTIDLGSAQKTKRSQSSLVRRKSQKNIRSLSEGGSIRYKSGDILDKWHDRILDCSSGTTSKYKQCGERGGDGGFESSGGTLSSEQESDQESLLSETELSPRKRLFSVTSPGSRCNSAAATVVHQSINSTTSGATTPEETEPGRPSVPPLLSPLHVSSSVFSQSSPTATGRGSCTECPSSQKHFVTSACHVDNKIGCTVWTEGEPSKIRLSALEIGSAIFERSQDTPDSVVYAVMGQIFAVFTALLPVCFKYQDITLLLEDVGVGVSQFNVTSITESLNSPSDCLTLFLSSNITCYRFIIISSVVNRLILLIALFFLLSVAERAFKRRFLTAKLFSHITSTRRSMKSGVPHFRLYKVRNIKAWLCVRSLLRRRGPQRTIDSIVSAAFIITLVNVFYLCYELLKEDATPEINVKNCEVICWCTSLGFFLVRFMTLASRTNQKYRNLSVLLTEQINLYLRMEEKPEKKEQLCLANNVLKLSIDLLKELEAPFKINGLSANPFLYNITKLLVLSAVSGALSEMLGFKLKLYKVKIK